MSMKRLEFRHYRQIKAMGDVAGVYDLRGVLAERWLDDEIEGV